MDLAAPLIALAADPRRGILKQLASGEARVTEVAAPFDISLNSVSKHIRILERADLVRRRVAGRDHFLSFNAAPLAEASKWIEQSRASWTGRLDALEAMLRADDAIAAAKKNTSPPPKRNPRRKQ